MKQLFCGDSRIVIYEQLIGDNLMGWSVYYLVQTLSELGLFFKEIIMQLKKTKTKTLPFGEKIINILGIESRMSWVAEKEVERICSYCQLV